MILIVLLFICTTARYQYLAEQEIINVITLPKEDALRRINAQDGPSYFMTKNRVRYNCTKTCHNTVERASSGNLLVVSKELLDKESFYGEGEYGAISIYPGSHLVISKVGESPITLLLDNSVKPDIRLGESNVQTAKRTEMYIASDHSSLKAKVLFICGEPPGYLISLLESSSESMVFSVASDRFCLTEEEESGYNEIRKRLSEPGNQKSIFTNNGWKYIVNHKLNITQIFITTNTEYNLGYYNATATLAQGTDIIRRFKLSDPHDSYVNIMYDNGDECATTGRARTTNVHLVCPSFSVLTDIAIETRHCHYEIYTSAPWVCSLPWMKKSKRAECNVVCYAISNDSSV